MAERRMFTKKITDDDHFISLSSSAQSLYLHLTMSADDDGFCNNVAMCIFKAHASVQDLEALVDRRFLIAFENGVIVIKHWRMANALRSDRYTPTAFQDEMGLLELKDNKSYTLKPAEDQHKLQDGCQTVAKRLPQNRTEQNRIDKNNNMSPALAGDGDNIIQEFADLWSRYPVKKGKSNAYRAYEAARKKGTTFEEVQEGLQKFLDELARLGTKQEYIPYGGNWFKEHRWEDDYTRESGELAGYGDSDEFYQKALQASMNNLP